MKPNKNTLKTKFQNRDLLFAGWTSMGHPQVTEMLARSGVDFIGIDIEHSTISQEQSQRIIAACHADGVCCLPRVASHNSETIKRLLDSGADGVIVPTVETSEQVEKLIEPNLNPIFGRSAQPNDHLRVIIAILGKTIASGNRQRMKYGRE